MPAAFVPFLKSGGQSSALAANPAIDSAAGAGAFAALVSGGSAATSTCAHTPAGAAAKPTVTLQKDGDRVTHIRIQCACGEVVELECAY